MSGRSQDIEQSAFVPLVLLVALVGAVVAGLGAWFAAMNVLAVGLAIFAVGWALTVWLCVRDARRRSTTFLRSLGLGFGRLLLLPVIILSS